MMDDLAEIRALYPNLSPDDLAAAKENLDRYLILAWEIWEEHNSAAAVEQRAFVDRPH